MRGLGVTVRYAPAFLFIGSVLIFLVSSCTTQLHVRPYYQTTDGRLPNAQGLSFSLPRTYLKAKITYSLIRESTWKADAKGRPMKKGPGGKKLSPERTLERWVVTKPVELSTITAPDPKLIFIVDIESLRQFLTGIPEAKFKLTEDGLMQKVNAEIADKTAETVVGFAQTILKIAKIAAVAGVAKVKEQIPVDDIVMERVLDISDFKKPESGKDEGEDGIFRWVYDDRPPAVEQLAVMGYDVDKELFPQVAIALLNPRDIQKPASLSACDLLDCPGSNSSAAGEGVIKKHVTGIPYRVPAALEIQVLVKDVLVQKGHYVFAQAGGVAFLPIYSKAFSASKTALDIATTTGAITSLTLKTTAPGVKAATTASGLSSEALKGIQELQTLELEFDTKKLEKEKKLFEAERRLEASEYDREIGLIRKKLEVLRLRKELRALREELELE